MSKAKVILIFLTLSVFLFHADGRTAGVPAKDGMAPSFTLKLLNGGDFKSSELKGRVAVLKFVASY